MKNGNSVAIIGPDLSIVGKLRKGQRVEIYGYVEGELSAESVVVHSGGRLFGKVSVGEAEVHGILQGDVVVRQLMSIRRSGTVSGNVQYGQLAMEAGASLSADVRNVPPRLSGDLEVTVERGRSVGLTLLDINAVDPDNTDEELLYTVSNAVGGHIALIGGTGGHVDRFTQADLAAGRVSFRHDGGGAGNARFDVLVTDPSGGSSGTPQTVTVTVRG